jgi:protein SERAC1
MFCFTPRQPTTEQTIDLVAIHGLGGHYNNTWTDANTKQNWLRDFFPEQIPQVRIMSWGYNSSVFGSPAVGDITSFAQALLNDLKGYRQNELEKRPLIFVCHSLGGVVFKRVRLNKL